VKNLDIALIFAASVLAGYILSGKRYYKRNIKRSAESHMMAAEEDLEAAESLAEKGNRLAAYHLQQASEKMLKGILKQHGMEPRKAHEAIHSFARIPKGDPILAILPDYSFLDKYSTGWRYPDSMGVIKSGMSQREVKRVAEEIRTVIELARESYGKGVVPDVPRV